MRYVSLATVLRIRSCISFLITQNEIQNLTDDGICVTMKGRIVKPKTLGQKKYVDAIRSKTIVLGVGPAGTGKTYLAVAMAVKAFRAHEVNKIILTDLRLKRGKSSDSFREIFRIK